MPTRREFLARNLAVGVALATQRLPRLHAGSAPQPASAPPITTPNPRWYEHAWRRAVIDMHIPDWDPQFLSAFDADRYVDALLRSRAQSIVCYAHSHVGLFNYPTRIGRPHAALGGRDFVAEMVDRCHRHGIAVSLYSSLIHDRWAFDAHPEWRMKHPRGGEYGANSRYGVVCPNSPYRDYVRDWVREMATRYDVEGFRFDMTFWVGVCYCDDCDARWKREAGGDMPRRVDWTDERWVLLQRQREEWLADFASIATDTVRSVRPHATVEHQSSTYPLSWTFGVSHALVSRNDFLQGDFYGDALQGSFVRKLLGELTPKRPFGYETSFSTELRDHTGKKSEELLEAKASAAVADGAAFIFIDAIDPRGSVNPATHDRMGRVFDRLQPFYAELGGERVADIAVFYSLDSKFDPRENGKDVTEASGNDTHTPAAMNAARALIAGHLPFTAVARAQLLTLADPTAPERPRLLILSNVHHLSPQEAEAIRRFVTQGGCLYASGTTSWVTDRGQRSPDFQLADVFGVSLTQANVADREHYVAPTRAGADLFPEWTSQYPAFVKGATMDVRAHADAQVLATRTLPWPAPNPTQFSSIHSNPPWTATDMPEVVLHRYGSGVCIYSASVLENVEALRDSFLRLLRRLQPRFTFEADAPASVELSLFRQRERGRYLLGLVNFQKDLPNIPVRDIRVRLRLASRVRRVVLLPDHRRLRHRTSGEILEFTIPYLETLALVAIETPDLKS